jgi:hypothetical protein
LKEIDLRPLLLLPLPLKKIKQANKGKKFGCGLLHHFDYRDSIGIGSSLVHYGLEGIQFMAEISLKKS